MDIAANPTGERELLAPLIEYYVREMGPIPGRLMLALSLLTDLEDSAGWSGQDLATRRAVHQARLLTNEVLKLAVAGEAVRG